MNSYERFMAFSARERIDRPLRRAHFTPDLSKRLAEAIGTEDFLAYFDMDDPGNTLPQPPPDFVAPDFSGYYLDLSPDEIAWMDAIGVARKPGSMYHFTERVSPLRNAEKLSELEDYPVINYAGWDESHMPGEVEAFKRNGRIPGLYIGHMYESAWQIRGYEQFLMDMALQPEWCEVLLDKFTERNVNLARSGARAGVVLMRCGDDVANQNALMFSADQWRTLMKPRWAKVCAAAHEIDPSIQILYHSDGNVECLYDELLEIGFTILNPLQPECMDLGRIAEKYKGKALFDGAIGTQSVMPFGTPDDVRASVKERVAQFGQDIMLAPTHILEPEVPIENIKAFFEACDKISFDN